MGKTIIQSIGPLYGEVVNGTVFGRPNGSIYVPLTNTIVVSLVDSYRYIKNTDSTNTAITVCNSSGSIPAGQNQNQINAVAESQDLQNYIQIEFATDSDFLQIFAVKTITAGNFNTVTRVLTTTEEITAGTTYYLRAVLNSSSGVPVAVSDSIEVEGYA